MEVIKQMPDQRLDELASMASRNDPFGEMEAYDLRRIADYCRRMEAIREAVLALDIRRGQRFDSPKFHALLVAMVEVAEKP